jgi:single-strand DNA-binding protein
MEITARIVRNAEVKTIPGNRTVVEFTVALKQEYRAGTERRDNTQFITCSYWRTEKVAPYLIKGTLIGLFGDIGVNAYVNAQGQPRANFTMHVNELKFYTSSKHNQQDTKPGQVPVPNGTATVASDDLPF